MAEKLRERMTAAEFFQLPETMQKTELIEGEVIVAPAPLNQHQRIVRHLFKLVESLIPNGEVLFSPADVEFDIEDVFQPDIFWVAEGGKAVELEGHYVGAPDLIVEVLSPSTAKYDKGKKFNTYEKFGVREYWMADPDGEYLEIWFLDGEKFSRLGVFGKDESFDSKALGKTVELKDIF